MLILGINSTRRHLNTRERCRLTYVNKNFKIIHGHILNSLSIFEKAAVVHVNQLRLHENQIFYLCMKY